MSHEGEDTIGLIKLLNKKLCEDFDNRLSEHGLTGQQGRILFYVFYVTQKEKRKVNQNDIEKRFVLSKSTVSGLVSRMEKNGLIERKKEKNEVLLLPTKEGIDLIEKIHSGKEQTIKNLYRGVDEKEKEEFENTLNKLIENIGGESDERKH